MRVADAESGTSTTMRSERFHLWRSRKDRAVRRAIAVGGVGVIGAVLLIFFYLLWVVFPLFLPASVSSLGEHAMPGWADKRAIFLAVEEQREVGLRLSGSGELGFFMAATGDLLQTLELSRPGGSAPVLAAVAVEGQGLVGVATEAGDILAFRHLYETRFSGGVETREIVPSIEYPYGESALLSLPAAAVTALALSESDDSLLVAAAGGDLIRVNLARKSENFLTGEVTIEPRAAELTVDFRVTALAVSANHRWLYAGDGQGFVHRYSLPDLQAEQLTRVGDAGISRLAMLVGGISLLVGDRSGAIHQMFPVRGEDNSYRLERIRGFEALDGAIVEFLPEERRKGFLALAGNGDIGVYHSTAGQLVARASLDGLEAQALALAPRANGLLVAASNGRLARYEIHNEHPEVSFASLWRKVWYENYAEPQYLWQSSAATSEFEPKFSLTPLVFGTVKAAVYAMLFAIPLALMGAAYTAYFMSPELRKWVKPGIEIMAALPTVILGFLAGLWFAPWVEEHLVDLFMMLLLVPPGLLGFAWAWHRWFEHGEPILPEGWEPLVLVPPLLVLLLLSSWLGEPVQALFFGGDLRVWLSNEVGISYDQRNALVVGCAMGFAVIPTIFSIAEDAVFGVPKSLSDGSLALGATPWQTLLFVVIPTASPGIFSALMIGLGRAVGETMIVLMATGNTPVMDWNLFEGMRTLAANIAVEMPESEVNSSHYRILFLAALVLFLFTFAVNTVAEVVRQRLRDKYSSL